MKRHPRTEELSHRLLLFTLQTSTFFLSRGNSRMHTATYSELHIGRSQAESQFAEALRNQKAQKESFPKSERGEGVWSVMMLS